MVKPVSIQAADDGVGGASLSQEEMLDHIKVQALIRAYRVRGHIAADTNPLSEQGSLNNCHVIPDPKLNLSDYGFSEKDLDREFNHFAGNEYYTTLFPDVEGTVTLRDITSKLEKLYCAQVGYQFKFIQNEDEQQWIQSKIEAHNQNVITPEEKRGFLEKLVHSDGFEQFLQKKIPS